MPSVVSMLTGSSTARVRRFTLLLACVSSALPGAAAHSACTYDRENGRIWVENYTDAFPCTPAVLLRADRMNDWGRVTHDRLTDTTTVDADLYLGRNDGTDTYFQLGNAEHPRETLVLNGNLVVYPYYIKGENAEPNASLAARGVNRITLGVEGEGSIQATLKIVSGKGSEHSLYFGRIPVPGAEPRWDGRGGQLCVYNSTITAAVPDRAHALGEARTKQVYLYGDRVVLKNAVLSWFAGVITFGLRASTSVVEDCVFEHSGYGLINAEQLVRRCIFRHLSVAVKDWGGPIDAKLIECTFENNSANWCLSRGRITCIDCVFGPPLKGNRVWKSEFARTPNPAPPVFTSRRHLIVEVADAKGRPIRGATVAVLSEQGRSSNVYGGAAVTDEQGRTPGQGSGHAILLEERTVTATDDPDKPETMDFSYGFRIAAAGYADAMVSGLKPSTSWQVVRVTMREAK